MIYNCVITKEELTEADIVNVLRSGRSVSAELTERAVRCLREQNRETDELIESAVLTSPRYRSASSMNHDIAYDAVSDAAEEASRLLAERRQDLYREMRRIRYADRRARSVWYGYDCLDEVQQAVLYRYYISRDCVKDIADSLHFSETTFWRKRREAMRRIQAICRQQTENAEK